MTNPKPYSSEQQTMARVGVQGALQLDPLLLQIQVGPSDEP